MDVRDYVVSAGRAVLDMVEREWQPLSPGELGQRLDQAVEEVLESELLARLKAQPAPVGYVQLPQDRDVSRTSTSSPPPSAESRDKPETAEDVAVKHITNLLQRSKSQARMSGRARLSLPHTVLLSLTLLSERVSYRSLSQRFHLEKGNIHRIFFSFCECVNALEKKLIRWPTGTEAVEILFPLSSCLDLEKEQEEDAQCVPRVLGVLGDTWIPIRLPVGRHDVDRPAPEVKRMKKDAHPESWLNLEVVCDRQGRFLHCRISKQSETDRGSTLSNKLKQNPELMPPGSCLVARAGYPLTAQILTPYTRSNAPKEVLFNRTLETHFHILDQAFADLRARFQRLRYLDIGSYDRARAVVLAACVLHNVFVDMGQVIQAQVEREETMSLEGEGEGEEEDEGVCRREGIADVLLKETDTGSK